MHGGKEEFLKAVAGIEDAEKKRIFALFCGGVDESTGKSWCPDCVSGAHAAEREKRAGKKGDQQAKRLFSKVAQGSGERDARETQSGEGRRRCVCACACVCVLMCVCVCVCVCVSGVAGRTRISGEQK